MTPDNKSLVLGDLHLKVADVCSTRAEAGRLALQETLESVLASGSFEYQASFPARIIGREGELQWLQENLGRSSFSPILIHGAAGVGKTTLLRHFFDTRRISSELLFLDLDLAQDPAGQLASVIAGISAESSGRPVTVAIDGAERLSDEQIESFSSALFNYKRARGLVLSTRRRPKVRRGRFLSLRSLSSEEAVRLFRSLLRVEVPDEIVQSSVDQTKRNPLALRLLAELLSSTTREDASDVISGHLYDVSKTIALPSRELVKSVAPKLVLANEGLLEQLKKQPLSLYELPPRKFEEILADLLADMGWDVELTKATRDGGKDILAYMETDLGRFLCLVEAKRYRRDHKVSVDLVRNLYGTLCDHEANSAMLVTTSSFTADARQFKKRHDLKLSLKDYGDVVGWIQRYKTGNRMPVRRV